MEPYNLLVEKYDYPKQMPLFSLRKIAFLIGGGGGDAPRLANNAHPNAIHNVLTWGATGAVAKQKRGKR